MDEVEIINNYLRMQSGEDTDLIIGTGYDTTLGKKLVLHLLQQALNTKILLQRKPCCRKKMHQSNEKIVMTLGVEW